MLDRVRLMRTGNSPTTGRPYQKVERVYAKNSGTATSRAFMDVSGFVFNVNDTNPFSVHMNKSYAATRAGLTLFLIGSNTCVFCYYWMGSDNKAYVQAVTRDSISSSNLFSYEYELLNGINNKESVTVNLSGSKPTISTNYSYKDNGYKTGTSSTFSSWKSNHGIFQCNSIALSFDPYSISSGRTRYIYEMGVTKNDTKLVHLVPVKFLDTNTYGFVDLISGNYIDASTCTPSTVTFYSD